MADDLANNRTVGNEKDDKPPATTNEKKRRVLSRELRCMMFGFGDDINPYSESVDVLEDLVLQYITDMTLKATGISKQGRIQVDDILHLLRRDTRKYTRVRELLMMNEELKKARKAFDSSKDYE
ncbi:unnamed protein product [Didymodactylos carnosus]|uniref:Transcription initiation factor TFIID subunit 13 n=1 Tax=Didymodactylos carnosus TaxID=1234261 RepID=A0A814EDU2_9BILA|nr:unnamed protein product [Didymodactylos carnosus]CAF1117396.1 unnamed protein product [Didymodactylos carnosus]CAF3741325.1 unnamed protein product [Didymodactylos carnosus]CAF3888781.1 unnamed protein product [Didymodactylos carnosus]